MAHSGSVQHVTVLVSGALHTRGVALIRFDKPAEM